MWGLAGGSWSPWLHPRKIQCLWPVLGLSSSLLLSCYAVSSGVLACLPITMPCPSQTPEQGRQSAAPRMGCQQFGEHPPQPGMRQPEELDGPRVSKSMISNHGCRTLAHGAQSLFHVWRYFHRHYIKALMCLNQKVPRPRQDVQTAMSYSRTRIEMHYLSLRGLHCQLVAVDRGRATFFRVHVSWQFACAPVNMDIYAYEHNNRKRG